MAEKSLSDQERQRGLDEKKRQRKRAVQIRQDALADDKRLQHERNLEHLRRADEIARRRRD